VHFVWFSRYVETPASRSAFASIQKLGITRVIGAKQRRGCCDERFRLAASAAEAVLLTCSASGL